MKKSVAVPPSFPRRGPPCWWFDVRGANDHLLFRDWAYLVYEQFRRLRPSAFSGMGVRAPQPMILFGMLLGNDQWFKRLVRDLARGSGRSIHGIAGGSKPADFDALVAIAGKFSRINTYLSVPMPLGMGARGHFSSIGLKGGMETGLGDARRLREWGSPRYHVVNGAAARVGREFISPPASMSRDNRRSHVSQREVNSIGLWRGRVFGDLGASPVRFEPLVPGLEGVLTPGGSPVSSKRPVAGADRAKTLRVREHPPRSDHPLDEDSTSPSIHTCGSRILICRVVRLCRRA